MSLLNQDNEDNPRGAGRMLIGIILMFSSFMNFFTNITTSDVLFNLSMFFIGVILSLWGYHAERNSEL